MTSAPPNPPSPNASSNPRIAIVGGGVIGLSAALVLAEQGASVSVYDAAPRAGAGASDAAAGMLAPAYEAAAEPDAHDDLFDLCRRSADIWPEFAARLTSRTGIDLGLGRQGALACALTSADLRPLERLEQACAARGVDAQLLSAREACAEERALSERLVGALYLPTDTQVDNRALIRALLAALGQLDIPVITSFAVTRLERAEGAWRTPDGWEHDAVVWTTGAQAGARTTIDGASASITPPEAIIPVKGQMLSVAPSETTPRRVLRFGSGYIAPQKDRVVIGASSHWGVDNRDIEADVTDALRRRAGLVCPGLASADIQSRWAGVRPGTPDHAPLIGWTRFPGLYLAAGHYRNGVLLAPLTAQIIADALLERPTEALFAAFSPDRFATASAVAAP
ncbi:MAG: glycine oxidase ThiO [Pseudomonadota bacterium]